LIASVMNHEWFSTHFKCIFPSNSPMWQTLNIKLCVNNKTYKHGPATNRWHDLDINLLFKARLLNKFRQNILWFLSCMYLEYK